MTAFWRYRTPPWMSFVDLEDVPEVTDNMTVDEAVSTVHLARDTSKKKAREMAVKMKGGHGSWRRGGRWPT